MKLIYCPLCGDVFSLRAEFWGCCVCGKSGGQYDPNDVTGVIGGYARVFGIGNVFFAEDWEDISLEERKLRRKEAGYTQMETDCWWGEFVGDVQITRIESATGPNPNWAGIHLKKKGKQKAKSVDEIVKELDSEMAWSGILGLDSYEIGKRLGLWVVGLLVFSVVVILLAWWSDGNVRIWFPGWR